MNKRLVSLDAFRGMTIALMILVNIPGSWSYVYPPFEHADWHGCTPTDLVFPFFLFIVGVAMAFSFAKYDYQLKLKSFLRVVERTFLIFFVGLLLNYYPFFKGTLTGDSTLINIVDIIKKLILSLIPFFAFFWIVKKTFFVIDKVSFSSISRALKAVYILLIAITFILLFIYLPQLLGYIDFYNKGVSHLRILGVLQRIALAYGFSAILILLVNRKYLPYVIAIILLLYWWLMWQFGGDTPYSLENNFGRQIDLAVLGDSHMWHGKGIAFDPEGLLSTIPSIATPMIGYLIGRFIKDNKQHFGKWFYWLIGYGVVLIVLGQLWNPVFPINKSLWTSSYVLYTAGLGTILLSLFYWLIDVKGYKKWSKFFIVFGINPLFAFVVHVLWVKVLLYIIRWENADGKITTGYGWLFKNVFQPFAGNMNGSFLFAITHIFIFWILLYILYKKKIIIKL